MSAFLTDAELYELTGKRQRPAQIRALNRIGIKFRMDKDRHGKPTHVAETWAAVNGEKEEPRGMINWEALKK